MTLPAPDPAGVIFDIQRFSIHDGPGIRTTVFVKGFDPETHRRYTGVGNELLLTNARDVARRIRTWFRVPLIAGFNDAPEHIETLAQLATELGIEKVSLLPYHRGGEAKSEQIGRTYRFAHGRAPEPHAVRRLAELIAGAGVVAAVGH
jgi:pyruvate formate lyase activating enzyme